MKISDAVSILEREGLEVSTLGDTAIGFDRFAEWDAADSFAAVFLHDKGSPRDVWVRVDNFKTGGYQYAVLITTADLLRLLPDVETAIIVEDPRLAFALIARELFGPMIHTTGTAQGGERCRYGANCVVGTTGLNANWHKDHWVDTPHLGDLIMGTDCVFGDNVIIQRGVLRDTTIGTGVHAEHNTVIGHGCDIGDHARIAANVTICGHARIGKRAWIGPNSVIKEGVTIEDNAFIGIGSVVIRDVPFGVTVAGNPARILQNSKAPW